MPRSLCFALLVALGCGSTAGSSEEPQTAKEKQKREVEAAGEAGGGQAKWGGWRYTGSREDCFFVVGRKCYPTEALACTGAKCAEKQKQCETTGGGPATVSCK